MQMSERKVLENGCCPFFFCEREVFNIAKANGNQMINDDIKFSKVRLIDADGQMVLDIDNVVDTGHVAVFVRHDAA